MSVDALSGGTAVVERLREIGVVPVVELPSAEVAVPLVEALVAGGLACIEITLRTPSAREGIKTVREAFPDVLLGAGTVLDDEQLTGAIAAGADFVVSPGLNPGLVTRSLELGVVILPGVCTPSEIELARRLGLTTVKFFPSEPLGGVRFLRALCGPYRDVAFVPTGGITPDVLADYLTLPQVVACGGSWMVKPELLVGREFDRVQSIAAATRAVVERTR